LEGLQPDGAWRNGCRPTAQEIPMSHDSNDSHAEAPSQGIFIGWMAIGLLVVMGLFTLLVIGSGAMMGFQ